MVFMQIVRALQANREGGAQAEQAARLGFLEWAMNIETDAKHAAQAALNDLHLTVSPSPATSAFAGLLRLAAEGEIKNPLRRGGAAGRRRVLH